MLRIETKDYDSPRTRRTIVTLEDAFCGSVIIYNPVGTKGEIQSQSLNTDFDHDFASDAWEGNSDTPDIG